MQNEVRCKLYVHTDITVGFSVFTSPCLTLLLPLHKLFKDLPSPSLVWFLEEFDCLGDQ